MKVKCPICEDIDKHDEYEVYTEFYDHLRDHADWILASYLSRTIFKIHDGIEVYTKIENAHDVKTEDKALAYHIRKELESLLEDKN